MVINHNISGIFAHHDLSVASRQLDKSMERLASGLRINRAGDDPAGLAISEKMRAQIRGLRQAERNAQDGISFIQTAEKYLGAIQSSIQRVRELSVQAANGIYTETDRSHIQVEVSQMLDEVDRVSSHAQFNKLSLMTGRFAMEDSDNEVTASMWIHLGANMDERERVYIQTMTAQALGLRDSGTTANPSAAFPSMSVETIKDANQSISIADEALRLVSRQRATLGAYQNRLELATDSIRIGFQNLQASESRIRDTDMAEESIELASRTILAQTATSILAQANLRPQLVLQLLR